MIWKQYKSLIIFIFFYILLRVILININITEWGDSFRILRAAQYVLHFSYPLDEKRLPFFSALLAPGLLFLEPVLWGRIYSILAAVTNLILTAVLYKTLFPKVKPGTLTLVLAFLAFNPIFFYWSLRIMAETTFAALVLLVFVIYFRGLASDKSFPTDAGLGGHKALPYEIGLGFVLALACLTRYEGFLLAGAFGLFFLIKRQWLTIIRVFLPVVLLVVPWFVLTKFILKGSTSDAYVSELGTFTFDLNRFGYFITYSLFFLGFPPLVGLLITNRQSQITHIRSRLKGLISGVLYSPLILFLTLEFPLFFIWTPSLPRIMLPVIPVVVIFFVQALQNFWGVVQESPRRSLRILIITFLSLLIFMALQFKFRLYFLVLSRTGLTMIIVLSLLSIAAIWFRSKKLFITSALISMLVGCLVVVANQRLVYSTIYQASVYAQALPGKIAYSDETGVSAWYLEDKGVYFPQNSRVDQTEWLQENQITYILDTNEFNRGSKLEVSNATCKRRFGVVIADVLDNPGLYQAGFLGNKRYPLLYTDVCKI